MGGFVPQRLPQPNMCRVRLFIFFKSLIFPAGSEVRREADEPDSWGMSLGISGEFLAHASVWRRADTAALCAQA